MNMQLPDTLIQMRYRIEHIVRQGGFGAVYAARDERLGRRVALKQLLHTGQRLSRQFEHEARLLANLIHPTLPRVTDHFATPAGQFLVMDFVSGADLDILLLERHRPFPIEDVLAWGFGLLETLHFLHSRQLPIIHRDIKPQNLKLQSDGRIMVLDFGLAKGAAGDHITPTTQSSLRAFTKGYASPEQMDGSGTDARSDLYALGMTLHSLLTNSSPPEATWRMEAAATDAPDPLRLAHTLNAAVPASVSFVLQQAVALSRDERPQSAQAMRTLLEAANASDHAASSNVWSVAPRPRFKTAGNLLPSTTVVVPPIARQSTQQPPQLPLDEALLGRVEAERQRALMRAYDQGRAALTQGNLDQARKHFEAVLYLDINHQHAVTLLAQVRHMIATDSYQRGQAYRMDQIKPEPPEAS